MDNQPAFDRSILIPIFISGCSVIGIVLVLLIGRSLNSPAEVPVTPSATRFQYVYLGTEPAITTPLGEETEPTDDPFEEPTEEPGGIVSPVIATPTRPTIATTPTRPGAGTPIVLTLPNVATTSPPTSTSASVAPLSPGTYDDVDSRLVYNGWNATGSSGNTLHVSSVPGSTVSFRFIGTQVRILYQGGLTLGQIRITIDNSVSETEDQSGGDNEWASDLLPDRTHTVLITHDSGGSVNLDEIIIPAVATPTPTRTPTP